MPRVTSCRRPPLTLSDSDSVRLGVGVGIGYGGSPGTRAPAFRVRTRARFTLPIHGRHRRRPEGPGLRLICAASTFRHSCPASGPQSAMTISTAASGPGRARGPSPAAAAAAAAATPGPRRARRRSRVIRVLWAASESVAGGAGRLPVVKPSRARAFQVSTVHYGGILSGVTKSQ